MVSSETIKHGGSRKGWPLKRLTRLHFTQGSAESKRLDVLDCHLYCQVTLIVKIVIFVRRCWGWLRHEAVMLRRWIHYLK